MPTLSALDFGTTAVKINSITAVTINK